MKTLPDLQLPKNVLDALQTARDRTNAEFAVDQIVLFGSVMQGRADEESDVDLLIR
ncbi:MAG TPA: nucleotidyltransferase domain-containing protein [Candidatus Binatia bacterium]|nr:nucleotidyltransferase domain-containing protein [Candidatus Binatia bacterium]